jgi:hypothetical protein
VKWVDRENLHAPDVERLDGLVCNGWYMYNPDHWPPSHRKALFTSFHVTTRNSSAKKLLAPHLREYYVRQFGSIGCRDHGTLRRFLELGVDAHYSACVTLTLQGSPGVKKNGSILVVDPFYHVTEDWEYQNWQLKRLLSPVDLDRVVRMDNVDRGIRHHSIEERMQNVRRYLDQITAADFVITSRIHAALPAIALGTPVYFTLAGYDRNASSMDRFDGITELFQILPPERFPFSSRKRWGKLLRWAKMHYLIPLSPASEPLRLEPAEVPVAVQEQVAALAQGIESEVEAYLRSLP